KIRGQSVILAQADVEQPYAGRGAMKRQDRLLRPKCARQEVEYFCAVFRLYIGAPTAHLVQFTLPLRLGQVLAGDHVATMAPRAGSLQRVLKGRHVRGSGLDGSFRRGASHINTHRMDYIPK